MRPRGYYGSFVGADPSEGRSFGRTAKMIGLFALFAVPVGFLLSAAQSRQQTAIEKAEFRRIGLNWDKRYQHPK